MEINSLNKIHAQMEYQKLTGIEQVEKRMKRLYWLPLILASIVLIYSFWALYEESLEYFPIANILTVFCIITMIRANIARTQLIQKLFELKYGS